MKDLFEKHNDISIPLGKVDISSGEIERKVYLRNLLLIILIISLFIINWLLVFKKCFLD